MYVCRDLDTGAGLRYAICYLNYSTSEQALAVAAEQALENSHETCENQHARLVLVDYVGVIA